MGCCGERDKGPPEKKQRWHYLDLNEFRCNSGWTYLAYGWLWLMAFVSISVYSVDTFTAINLLVFDHWSSQVQPWVPFRYSRWIFAGCILASFALLAYEWVRALRVIRRDGVAASYMDRIAASVQCMKSQGWKRFLVFTELTKSKKGTDYIAFFVYFAFSGAIRIIVCEAPRQAINGITLYAVLQAKILNPENPDSDQSSVSQFFSNVGAIYNQNYLQAMIYTSMLFTLTIWVFSALCLAIAGLFYIMFLWHYIPQRDGRLRIYCRRKIDRRLEKVVETTAKASLEWAAKKKEKEERREQLRRQKTGEPPLLPPGPGKLSRAATLQDLSEGKKSSDGASLQRQNTNATTSTLPLYSAKPPPPLGTLQRQPTLPDLDTDLPRPPLASRSATQMSALSKASFESDAPLLPNAGYAGGDDRVASPAPTYYSGRKPSTSSSIPARTNTQSTQASQRSFYREGRSETPASVGGRSYTSAGPGPGMRSDTPASIGQQRSYTPGAPIPPRVDTSFTQPTYTQGPMTNTPTSAGPPRSYTPMSTTSARTPPGQRFPVRSNTGFSSNDPQSAISEPGYGGRPPPMRQNTYASDASGALPFRPGPPQRKDSEVSYFSRPVAQPTPPPPPPMQRQMMYDSFAPPPPPPMQRNMTYDSVNPPLRAPTAQSQHSRGQSSFSRPFTAMSNARQDQPTPPPGSYEMNSQPAPMQQQPQMYMPFNPGAQRGGTIVQEGPQRNGSADDYLDVSRGQGDGRVLSSYGSILEEYSAPSPQEWRQLHPGNGGRY